MVATWKQYEGQAVDGIPLLRLLGESDGSAVYLGELTGEKCAIKLVPAEEAAAQVPLARWQQASKLSHPHLTRIHQWGRAKLDGRSFVYLAMEYAEEALANVERPLTPKEAREMLTPAVAALAYIHSKGMAHGHLRPSNILSVNDVLKISGDAPLRVGEMNGVPAASPVYDAPEMAASGVSAAADAWSLGVILVEALTKKLPVGETDPPRLPDALLPDSFREVAAGCLRRDPAMRWTIADVRHWLERGTIPAPKRARRKYLIPAAAVAVLAIAGVIAWPHLGSSSANPAVASQPVTSTPPAPPPPSASPAPNANATAPEPAPARSRRGKATRPVPQAVAPVADSAPRQAPAQKDASQKQPPATEPDVAAKDLPPAAGDAIPADVVQPVRPDVPPKARLTIRGKVPISVRVETDATGAVTDAKVQSGGSSAYFADLSLKAARGWKFAASDGAGVWLLRFEFTRNAQVSTQATRIR